MAEKVLNGCDFNLNLTEYKTKKGQFNNCPFTNVNPQTHIVLNARLNKEMKFYGVFKKFKNVILKYL